MDSSYVGKPCPKCKHVRAASENSPEWQCPKCGIAYAKFVAPRPSAETGAAIAPAVGGAALRRAEGQSYTLAAAAHFSILLGFILPLVAIVVPIVIWKTKGEEDEFAAAAAKEAINFQLSFILWLLGIGLGSLLGMVTSIVMIPLGLLLVAVLLGYLVLPIVAAVKTLGGDSYTYPFIKHFFE